MKYSFKLKIISVLSSAVILIGLIVAFPNQVSAATFTVDSTGDGADAATDGLCATAGGVCTLRAAIAEANATAGPHTIGFSINTTDGGYVDFDGGAGDGTGGDDYWLITPATVLPTITSSSVTINGAIQTTNWGDKNTSGPEIMLDGHTGGNIRGMVFSGINGTVNSLTLYRFGESGAAIEVTADGFTLTNSYIGTTAKGLAGTTGTDRSAIGVYMNLASGTIGTTTSNGNVISGNITYGIYAACGATPAKTVNIAGNKIGLGSDGTAAIGNGSYGVYLENDCRSIVGGDTAANRNYIGSNSLQILTSQNTASDTLIEIYNNFLGTDITGTLDRGSTSSTGVYVTGSIEQTYVTVIIGAQGKGNLIRYWSTNGIRQNVAREMDVGYNTISNGSFRAIELRQNVVMDQTLIHHNNIGAFTPDSYFGLNTGTNIDRGILVNTTQSVRIFNNFFQGNSIGIGAGGFNTSIYNNIFNATGGISVRVSNSSVSVHDNEIRNAGSSGLDVINNGKNNKFRNNIITNSNPRDLDFSVSTLLFTPNDAGDVDDGNNHLQNWPEVQTVSYLGAGVYRVSGRLDGNTAEDPFEIEICESSKNLTTGHGGCADPLDVITTASTPDSVSGASNYYNWTADVQTQYTTKHASIAFTGLATNVLNSTSEFGTNFICTDDTVCPVVEYNPILITPIDDSEIADATPFLDWTDTNPEVDHYDVIMDGEVIATVDDAVTEYQTTVDLSEDAHTWQIMSYRVGNELIGASEEESFVVNLPEEVEGPVTPSDNNDYSFDLLSPINSIVIEDTTPYLDWEDIIDLSEADFYDLYMNDKFVVNTGMKSEYTLKTSEALDEGLYSWYVIAYKSGSPAIEVGRSGIETFKIDLPDSESPPTENPPVKPPVTGEKPDKSSDKSPKDLLGILKNLGMLLSEHIQNTYNFIMVKREITFVCFGVFLIAIIYLAIFVYKRRKRESLNAKRLLIPVLFFIGFQLLFVRSVNAATFTVDSTGDAADASINGLCATAGGVCTLRAAVAEANAAVGPHTIGFNISTSDGNYVDFDGGAGDGLGGDDYWRIIPTTVLPTITASGVTIDGATQTINQGDRNTSGPEIELRGSSAGSVIGLNFSSSNDILNSLVINSYRPALPDATVKVVGSNFLATNNYIGTNIKGTTSGITVVSRWQMFISGGSNNIVGQLSNGNVFQHITGAAANHLVRINTDATGTVVAYNTFANAGEASISDSGVNSTIEYNSIQNCNTHPWASAGCIQLGGSTGNVIVRHNTISNNAAAHGIIIYSANTATTYDIHDNTITQSVSAIRLDPTIFGPVGTAKFQSNLMYSNSAISVDIVGGTEDVNGVTANDAGDVDTGANNLMNTPEIQSVSYLGIGMYRISGRVDGKISEAPFEIEICESDNHLSSHGGCSDSLGIVNTASTPDSVSGSSNYFNWTADLQTQYMTKHASIAFTGLATNVLNSTSEFGNNFICVDDNVCPVMQYDPILVTPIDDEEIADTTPLLDWTDTNPEIDHYDVVVDGVVLDSVNASETEFQIITGLTETSHTWQIMSYRVGDELIGTSEEESFVVNLPDEPVPELEEPTETTYEFELIKIIDGVIIVDSTPRLDWEDVPASSGLDFYDLYINNKFVANTGKISEYQIPSDDALDAGSYNWQVFAYKYVNGKAVEISHTAIETFKIKIKKTPIPETPTENPPIKPPVTGEEPDVIPDKPSKNVILKGEKIFICSGILLTLILGIIFFIYKRKNEKQK